MHKSRRLSARKRNRKSLTSKIIVVCVSNFPAGASPLRFLPTRYLFAIFLFFLDKIVNEWHDFCSIYSEHINHTIMGAIVVDMKMFWRVQPIKEGQATNEVFFKWLGFNIFGKRFNRYEELYKKHLFRSFTKKPNMFAYETYEEFAERMGETEEEMRENIATMTEWLKGLKDYERPRFYTFPNDTRLSAKYVVQAMIGYDNRKVINIMSNKPFKSFSIW